jgi:FkbM family methyltransferase
MSVQVSTVTVEDIQFRAATDSNADDPVSQTLARGEYPDTHLFHLLRELLPSGGRVMDVGAHIGTFSLLAAAAGYEVLAVEASASNAALLRESVAANGWSNLHIAEVAISDEPGILRFSAFGPYGHVFTEENNMPSIEIEAATVDGVLERFHWDRVDFIKMDIEGSEVKALRGMRKALAARPTPCLFYESNGHTLNFYGETPRRLKQAVSEMGLTSYLAREGRFLPVEPEDIQGDVCVDYLAVREMPEALKPRIGARPSQDDIARRLAGNLRSSAEPEVLYALRTLADCPTELLRHSAVVDALKPLNTSDSDKVRELASRYKSAQKSFWQTLLGR